MSDVRLTATNPEDSSVVPVACNAKGELKLEEPIAPPEFDGNLDGDLTVTGSATFSGRLDVTTLSTTGDLAAQFKNESAGGARQSSFQYTNAGELKLYSISSNPNPSVTIESNDGSASFSGLLKVADPANGPGAQLSANGSVFSRRDNSDPAIIVNNGGYNSGNTVATINGDGSASFSGDVVIGSRSKQWMLVEQGGLCHMVEQVRAADLVDPAAEYPKLRDVFKELNTIERCLEEVMTKLRMTEPDGWPVWDGSDNSQ